MPSVAATLTLRQYPPHPAATTIKQTAHGSPLRPILSTEHHIIIPHCPRPRPPTTPPVLNPRAPVFRPLLHHESEAMAMHTPVQIRRHCMSVLSSRHGTSQIPVLPGSISITGDSSNSSNNRSPRQALPRKIASGVFFIDPTTSSDAAPSLRTLLDLSITHAVVARGCGTDLLLSSGMKALYVGPHDPLSRIVSWMRAVRSSLGACIIVSDIAAAAGYLVVELGLSPRSAWLRIARGVPPPGDLVLARLCALALAQQSAANVNTKEGEDQGQGQQVSKPDRASDEEARSQRKSQDGSDSGWSVAPRSCRSVRRGTRGESSLKHVLVSSL